MPSQTLTRLEAVAAQIVAQPLPEIVEQLQEIANSEPQNPAPYIVLAIVTGFGHSDLSESKKHLAEAEERLGRARGRTRDAELEFTRTLFEVVSSEILIREAKSARVGGIRPNAAERERILVAAETNRQAKTRIDRLARQLRDSALVQTIAAALKAHALTNGLQSSEYQRGMSMLQHLVSSNDRTADIAGLFLYYGYRRSRDYERAIKCAENLVERNPRSALPRVMLGRAHQLAGNHDVALNHFEKATAIAPNNPFPLLGYAGALRKVGETDEARDVLEKVRALDPVGKLAPFIEDITDAIEITERHSG